MLLSWIEKSDRIIYIIAPYEKSNIALLVERYTIKLYHLETPILDGRFDFTRLNFHT